MTMPSSAVTKKTTPENLNLRVPQQRQLAGHELPGGADADEANNDEYIFLMAGVTSFKTK